MSNHKMGGVKAMLGQFKPEDFSPIFCENARPTPDQATRRDEVNFESNTCPPLLIAIWAGDRAFLSMTTRHCSLPTKSDGIRWYTTNYPNCWSQARGAMATPKN
jgi:hypothetical protein